jgi:hypothetical protein
MAIAKDHLNVNGSLLFNVHGSVKGPKDSLSNAVYRTAKEVFPNVYVFNVGNDPYALQNMIIVASACKNNYSKQEYAEKAQELAEKGGVKNLGTYASHYVDGLDDSKAPVLTDDHAPVENLLMPLIDP